MMLYGARLIVASWALLILETDSVLDQYDDLSRSKYGRWFEHGQGSRDGLELILRASESAPPFP